MIIQILDDGTIRDATYDPYHPLMTDRIIVDSIPNEDINRVRCIDGQLVVVDLPPCPNAERIESLRASYRQATQALCSIAGWTLVNKLEDYDFVSVRATALAVPGRLSDVLAICDTLSYCLFQLYRLDGNEAWGNI